MFILTVMILSLYANATNADEPITQKVTNWFQSEWVKTVEFQKESWAQAKEQTQKNKSYIQDLFAKVKANVSQD